MRSSRPAFAAAADARPATAQSPVRITMALLRSHARDAPFLSDDPEEKDHYAKSAPLGGPNIFYGVGTVLCLFLTAVAVLAYWRSGEAPGRVVPRRYVSDPAADAAALRRLQPVRSRGGRWRASRSRSRRCRRRCRRQVIDFVVAEGGTFDGGVIRVVASPLGGVGLVAARDLEHADVANRDAPPLFVPASAMLAPNSPNLLVSVRAFALQRGLVVFVLV